MIGWKFPYYAGVKLEQLNRRQSAIAVYSNMTQRIPGANAKVYFRLGHAQFMEKQDQAAISNIRRAIELEPNHADWHYRLGFVLERNKQPHEAIEAYQAAIALDPTKASWHHRASKCLMSLGKKAESLDSLRLANAVDPVNKDIALDLANRLRAQGLRWQEINVAGKIVSQFPDDHDWSYRYANALEAMNRFAEAASFYSRANDPENPSSATYFREGHCWQRAEDLEESEKAFTKAISTDTKLNAQRFGIGAFYQKDGDWTNAATAYGAMVQIFPDDAELHYRLGLSFERCYEWTDAARHYTHAIRISPSELTWHYRLGFANERMENWLQAAAAYRYAAQHSPKLMEDWYYRQGYCLHKAGDDQSASLAFLASVEMPLTTPIDAEDTRKRSQSDVKANATYISNILVQGTPPKLSSASLGHLASKAEKAHDWHTAISLLDQAVRCSDTHNATLLYRLGRAQHYTGDYSAAVRTFLKMHIFSFAHGISTKGYTKDVGLFESMKYVSWSECLPIEENTVFYESFHSASISCNPLQIYRTLRDDPRYGHLQHVWSVTSSTNIPEDVARDSRTITVTRNSDAYRMHLATAKFLVSNVTFPAWFIRRDGQKYLNTWHGTPLKTLGRDIKSGFLEHKNVARNFLQATHVISGNAHTTRVLTENYDVGNLWSAKVAETGYPRVDRTLIPTQETLKSVTQRLGLPAQSAGKLTILYAPTWRGGLNTRHFNVDGLLNDLQALRALDANVLFQAHHYTRDLLKGHDLDVTFVPDDIETNDLLTATDILITDYSSIAIDFLATKRPLIFYTYDFEEYSSDRGLYFSKENFPGTVCDSQTELIEELTSIIEGRDALDASPYTAQFCRMDDGIASARVISFFMEDDPSYQIEVRAANRKSILFHHSFIPNGITSSIQNLIRSLAEESFDCTVVVPAETTADDPLRVQMLADLPETVNVVGRTGRQVFTPEEKWIFDKFNKYRTLTNDAQWSVYRRAFEREFRRIFGVTDFDAIIEFEGYSILWSSILGFAKSEGAKSIYLHSDMASEWRVRSQYLESLFSIYWTFDNLISVSPSIAHENRQQLSGPFGVKDAKFKSAVNQIAPDKILNFAKSQLDNDLLGFRRDGAYQLVTLGRLSPEKDHAKLIRALKLVVDDQGVQNDVQLTILGDGPLAAELSSLIGELDLENHVLLGGLRSNPFALLAACDAFVLSSNHEGQPMVLLEALILGRRILATDIVGSRYVLGDNLGELVDNSVEGLALGMRKLLAGEVPSPLFDAASYTQNAKKQFFRAAMADSKGSDDA